MTRVCASLASVLVGVLVVAGCAGDPSTESSTPAHTSYSAPPAQTPTSITETSTPAPAPDAAPATGNKIRGTGYAFNLPAGWARWTQPIPGFDPDRAAYDRGHKHKFPDNVSVVLSPAGEVTADRIETDGVKELEASGATDVSVERRLSVAGGDTAHLTASMSTATNDYVADQYFLTDHEQTYILTFSFSPSVSARHRQDVAESTLMSWTWPN